MTAASRAAASSAFDASSRARAHRDELDPYAMVRLDLLLEAEQGPTDARRA